MNRLLAAFFFAALAGGTAVAETPRATAQHVVLVAHRGLAPGLPENTMAAFEASAAAGVRVIEIDLRGTADGEIVILHDETVDRTTNGKGAVSDLTLAEVRALDAGVRTGPAYAGQRVPTYAEALAFARRTGVILLLDIKESKTLDIEKIVRLTEANEAVLNVIVGARSLSDLARFQSLNPNLRTLGFIPDASDIDAFVTAGADIIRLWPEWIRGEASARGPIPAICRGVANCLVSQVQARGRPVWTTAGEAGEAELRELIGAGVNGILTDRPDLLSSVKAGLASSGR